ncbi:MAG: HAMP domain-containing sensor histidine kinase [Anditalea sp.]
MPGTSLELPKDAKINLNFEEEEINHVRGYIFSVISNLLSNCIQYRKNDIPLEINIETWKQGAYTVLSIEDNGIGMDFEDIKSDLFKPFKRFTTGGEGKGIGLHLIKSMVEKTGGKIEVHSEEGKGTKFYIYFKDQKSEYTSDRR